jgi:hypothetical protein
MKTSEWVSALSEDRTLAPAPGRLLAMALPPAAFVALALLWWLAGFRADLLASLGVPRFSFKLLLNLTLWLGAGGMLLRLAYPEARVGGWRVLLWLVPLLLIVGAFVELTVLPQSAWWDAARGQNATWCLRMIPAVGAVPLLASLWCLRRAAPGRPVLAGAAAGLMSAGLAGFFYGLHCTDDSPLFVALWYSLAAALLTGAGAVLGARLLRW